LSGVKVVYFEKPQITQKFTHRTVERKPTQISNIVITQPDEVHSKKYLAKVNYFQVSGVL